MGCGGSVKQAPICPSQLRNRMSTLHIQCVRDTWPVIRTHEPNAGYIAFAQVFVLCPDFKPYFFGIPADSPLDPADPRLLGHGEAFMTMLGHAVDALEETQKVIKILHQLGEFHVPLKVDVKLFWKIWPGVDFMLRQVLGPRYSQDIQEAWSKIFDFLVEKMAEGAQNLLQRQRRDRKGQDVPEGLPAMVEHTRSKNDAARKLSAQNGTDMNGTASEQRKKVASDEIETIKTDSENEVKPIKNGKIETKINNDTIQEKRTINDTDRGVDIPQKENANGNDDTNNKIGTVNHSVDADLTQDDLEVLSVLSGDISRVSGSPTNAEDFPVDKMDLI